MVNGKYQMPTRKVKAPARCFRCGELASIFRTHGDYGFCKECWNTHFVRGTGTELEGTDRTREVVRIRDRHICQQCFRHWKIGERRFDIHHVEDCGNLTYAYDKIGDISKLRTMCHKCHINLPENIMKMKFRSGNVRITNPRAYKVIRDWQMRTRGY